MKINGVKHPNPRMEFKDDVRCQCSQAAKAGPPEDVLILNIVHEELNKKGIEIGSGRVLEYADLRTCRVGQG